MKRVLLLAVLLLAAFSQATGSSGGAYIRILPDGSVEPPSAHIRRVGDVYLLLEDVSTDGDGILVERSGAVLDGNWRVLWGRGGSRGVVVLAVNVTVRNIVVRGFEYGIYVSGAPLCSVQGVVVEGGRVGIGLWESPGCIVVNSTARWSMLGLHLEESSRSTIVGNTFEGCGLYVRRSYGNRVENNSVNGRHLVYLEGVSGARVRGVVGQAILLHCTNSTVSVNATRTTVGVLVSECQNVEVVGCRLGGNVVSIDVWSSSGVMVSGCTVATGEVGVRVYNSSGVTLKSSSLNGSSFCVYVDSSENVIITNSTLKGCLQAAIAIRRSIASVMTNFLAMNTRGIVLQSSEGVEVVGNAIWRNGAGVVINASRRCVFSRNEFIENTAHVVIQSTGPNIWLSNFWSDLWQRSNLSGPYVLGEGNADENPLNTPSLVLPLTAATPIGYASGSGWYEKGSTARVAVWPSNLLLIRFNHWIDQHGNVVAYTPEAEVFVNEPLVLNAVWSLDPYSTLTTLLLALTLMVLTHRLRKKVGGRC